MAIEVAKVILKNVQDASDSGEGILAGQFDADQVAAVIDKDPASSLLARRLGADAFVISTSMEKVAIEFITPR